MGRMKVAALAIAVTASLVGSGPLASTALAEETSTASAEEKGDPRPSNSTIVSESATIREQPDLAAPSDEWTLEMVEPAIVAYVQTRNSQRVAESMSRDGLDRLLDSSGVKMSKEADAALDLAISQSESRRSFDAEFGIEYSHFETDLKIEAIKVDDLGERITVTYWEETELHFADQPYFANPKSADEANYTGYSEEYTAIFQLDKSSRTPSITLDSVTVRESELPPTTEPRDPDFLFATRAEFEDFLRKEEASHPVDRTGVDAPDPVLNSNGEMMPEVADIAADAKSVTQPPLGASGVSSYAEPSVIANYGSHPSINIPDMSYYAWVHALSFNTGFKLYNNDCANFVSQILSYGGWSKVWPPGNSANHVANSNYWFYVHHNNSNQGTLFDYNSYTWSASENLHTFARSSGRTHWRNGIWNLREGDFLVVDWNHSGRKDHSMYVSERRTNPHGGVTILISQHTTNRFKFSLHESIALSIDEYGFSPWWYTQATH